MLCEVPWLHFNAFPDRQSQEIITLRPIPGYGISCIGFYRPMAAPMFTEAGFSQLL